MLSDIPKENSQYTNLTQTLVVFNFKKRVKIRRSKKNTDTDKVTHITLLPENLVKVNASIIMVFMFDLNGSTNPLCMYYDFI